MIQNLYHQTDFVGPSLNLVGVGVAHKKVADKDRMDCLDIEPLIPFEQKAEELCCLNKQTDQALRTGWGLVLHILAAEKLYTPLHHTSCSA